MNWLLSRMPQCYLIYDIMAYYSFEASRFSGDGNAVFPDEIIIDDEEEVVIHRKPKIIGCKETQIRFGAIASIQVEKHILFSDIIIDIETRGGREIVARGFTREDADEIKELINLTTFFCPRITRIYSVFIAHESHEFSCKRV